MQLLFERRHDFGLFRLFATANDVAGEGNYFLEFYSVAKALFIRHDTVYHWRYSHGGRILVMKDKIMFILTKIGVADQTW